MAGLYIVGFIFVALLVLLGTEKHDGSEDKSFRNSTDLRDTHEIYRLIFR